MTVVETVSVFVGIPVLVVFLVALPIFGRDWATWVLGVIGRRRREPPES